MTYALANRSHTWETILSHIWKERHGGDSRPPAFPETFAEQHRFITETRYRDHKHRDWQYWRPIPTFDLRNVMVIGKVSLRNAIQDSLVADGTAELNPWRGQSAVIDELFIPPPGDDAAAEAGCDLQAVATAVSDRYGVPCTVGPLPPYTQADWDERTRRDDWQKFGLYPPGKEPWYGTVTLPAREPEPARAASRFFAVTLSKSAESAGESNHEVERRQRDEQLRDERRRFDMVERAWLARGKSAGEIRARYRAGRL